MSAEEPGMVEPRVERLTRSGSGLATSGERTLRDDPLTRVVGFAWIVPHKNGPNTLTLRLQSYSRQSRTAEWGPKTQINLEAEDAEALFEFLSEQRNLAGFDASTDYVVVKLDRSAPDPRLLTRLLTYFQTDPRLFLGLEEAVGEGGLEAIRYAGNLVRIRRATKELARLVEEDPSEGVFQTWFEAHSWVFGSEYVAVHRNRIIDLDAQADVIFETADGYSDVFEIKRPSARV